MKQTFHTLLFIMSGVLFTNIHAEKWENPLSHSPMQAGPVLSFIHLISDVRNATSASSAAKATSLQLFNELYGCGNTQVQELLGVFVEQLRSLLKKRWIMPSTKERCVVLLLEETKSMLRIYRKELELQEHIKLPDPALFTQALYTALNPTFGDRFRFLVYSVGSGLLITAGLFGLYLLYRAYLLAKSIQDNGTPVGRLADEIGHQMKYSREHPDGVSLIQQLAIFTEDLNKVKEMPKTRDEWNALSLNQHLWCSISSLCSEINIEINECEKKGIPVPKGTFGRLIDVLQLAQFPYGEDVPLHDVAKFLNEVTLAIKEDRPITANFRSIASNLLSLIITPKGSGSPGPKTLGASQSYNNLQDLSRTTP